MKRPTAINRIQIELSMTHHSSISGCRSLRRNGALGKLCLLLSPALIALSSCTEAEVKRTERLEVERERAELAKLKIILADVEAKNDALTRSRGELFLKLQEAEEQISEKMESIKRAEVQSSRLQDMTEEQEEQVKAMILDLESYVVQISVMAESGKDSVQDAQIRSLRNRAKETLGYLDENFPSRRKSRIPGSF